MRKQVIQIRVSDVEKQRFVEAAHRNGLDLSQWMRLVLSQATQTQVSQQTLLDERERPANQDM